MKLFGGFSMIGVATGGNIFCYDTVSFADHRLELAHCRDYSLNMTSMHTGNIDKLTTVVQSMQDTLKESLSTMKTMHTTSVDAIKEMNKGFLTTANKMIDSNRQSLQLLTTVVNLVASSRNQALNTGQPTALYDQAASAISVSWA